MKIEEFNRTIKTSKLPVMVEFWASWCGPCKVMAPALKETSRKFEGKVKLVKINADESPELLRSLKVLSIPTVMGYRDGELVFRKGGAQPASVLDDWFADLAEGREVKMQLRPADRWLRTIVALILAGIGLASGPSIFLLVLAGLFLFSAVYDRCPIYKAIAPRMKGLLSKAKS
ncbi:MAG: thioredoxin [Bellilinea sp.]